jgi:hypothetical protein
MRAGCGRATVWLGWLLLAIALSGCVAGSAADSSGEMAPQTATLPPLRIVQYDGTVTMLPVASLTRTPAATDTAVPTATPTATATATAAATPTPTETPTPTPTPTATAVPITVNGVPLNEIVLMDDAVRRRVRETFALGQQLGRDANAFSKIGDSVALTPHYLTLFDRNAYVLGEEYVYLQPAIDHYSGSWERYGVATRIGLHAWSLFDPLWADKEWCQPNEDMVACEVRLNNPSVLLVRLGSNDAGAAAAFDENMRLMVDYALANGIIPILSTKADRFEGEDNRNNLIVRQIAADYSLPLWDFDRVAETLPNKGLGGDQVHMTMSDTNDYTNPEYFKRGYPMSDLTALMTIFEVLQVITAVP